jgi:RNase P/RNase MRP subunit POP5
LHTDKYFADYVWDEEKVSKPSAVRLIAGSVSGVSGDVSPKVDMALLVPAEAMAWVRRGR